MQTKRGTDEWAELFRGTDLRALLVKIGDERGIPSRGSRYACPNPQHEQLNNRRPQAGVFVGKSGYDLWKCHGCGATGSAFTALVLAGRTREQASDELRELAGLRPRHTAPRAPTAKQDRQPSRPRARAPSSREPSQGAARPQQLLAPAQPDRRIDEILMWKLPGWHRARIERWAVATAITFVGKTDPQLTEAHDHCKRELRTGPRLAIEVDLWAAKHWRAAARELAVAHASAGARALQASPLAYWRALLLEEDVARIIDNAVAWSKLLPNDRVQRDRIEREMERANVFGTLDRAVGRWAAVNRRPLAELVAIEHELTLRRQISRIDRMPAEVVMTQALMATLPATDEMVRGLRRDIGSERYEVLLARARAIQPHVSTRQPDRLLAWHASVGRPFDELDPGPARNGHGLEQAWREAAMDKAQAEAGGRAALSPRERQVHVDAWKAATKRMRTLEQQGMRQWLEGSHVDRWWLEHGLAAATQLAIGDGLVERGLAGPDASTAVDQGNAIDQGERGVEPEFG